jgi:predicted nucleotidyltransferase
MDKAIQRELDLIKESILKTVPAQAIYLFGSYAYGIPNQDSDLDIYVVVPDIDIDTLDAAIKIRNDLFKKKTLPLDLLISKQSRFNKRKEALTLESIVSQNGVMIYGN